jgi:hypothetical protein
MDDLGRPSISVEIENHWLLVHEFWVPERTILASDDVKDAPAVPLDDSSVPVSSGSISMEHTIYS